MGSDSETVPELSVVVPVYNNATTLERFYHGIRQVLDDEKITFELLFVDDAGPDNSLDIATGMAGRYSEVVVVCMRNNVGQHAAVLHGLRFASGDCCLVMDADLQDPVEALPLLWHARSGRHQAVFAGRRGIYQNLLRMMTSRCYKTLLHYLAGLPNDAGIFVLMERELVDEMLRMPVRTPWINVMIGLSGLSLCSIPVERNARENGISAYSEWARLRSAMRGVYCAVSYRWWRPKQSYLESLDRDPVRWIKTK